jgi:hypothetical protein
VAYFSPVHDVISFSYFFSFLTSTLSADENEETIAGERVYSVAQVLVSCWFQGYRALQFLKTIYFVFPFKICEGSCIFGIRLIVVWVCSRVDKKVGLRELYQ